VTISKSGEKNSIVPAKLYKKHRKILFQDCYVIDTRESVGLLVWLGMKSEIDEREESARKAELYLREKGYDHATPVSTVCIMV
jgi:hypothetical protein